MLRTMLATTALATLLATGAYAQDSTAPAPAAPAVVDPAAPALPADAMPADAMTRPTGHLASNIIGENVYNGTADDAENIGDVNDLVLDADGNVTAVVVGVGGFLGIGQKDVSVDYATLDWVERNGDRWLVAPMTKEQLAAQPAFDRNPYMPAPAATAMTEPAMGVAPAPATGTDSMAAQAPAPAEAPATTAPAAGTDSMAQAPAADGTAIAPAPDASTTAAIDRSTLTAVPTETSSEELVGTTVYGSNDANVGQINDIIIGQDNTVDAYVIGVGGFLGIGEKNVAVAGDNLAFMQDASGNKYLYTEFTREQLDAQPAYDAGSYAQQRDQQRLSVQ